MKREKEAALSRRKPYCARNAHMRVQVTGDRMKVTIDRKQCVSCGSCWDTCPALFVQNDDDSSSQIVPEYQEKGDPGVSVVLPEGMDCARDAADLCPVTIITVEE